jgi:hypothetical protein
MSPGGAWGCLISHGHNLPVCDQVRFLRTMPANLTAKYPEGRANSAEGRAKYTKGRKGFGAREEPSHGSGICAKHQRPTDQRRVNTCLIR